ncbi:hypothetical protein [Neisseria wadsworthii]|uniref:hypothetical protein n=1 Tax=Neisseria wadsworthii TaxID=607711 RepID=UPI0012EA5985|nr:hypothetical protein [Neisseria wadsworthii]QMT36391.1 hypothetical protein H3L96_03990 [Neisseria wadsworthii]
MNHHESVPLLPSHHACRRASQPTPRRAGILARRMIQTCKSEWRAGMLALRMIVFRQALFFQTALFKSSRIHAATFVASCLPSSITTNTPVGRASLPAVQFKLARLNGGQ